MVEIADIKNRDSLRAWLGTQPQKTSVAIAQRVAMRVLPLYWEWELEAAASRNDDLTALPVLYRLLTSGVAANSPSPAITRYICEAAASATATTAAMDNATIDANSAYSAAQDAASAAAYVAYATYATFTIAAYTTTVDRWSILRAECAEFANQGFLAEAKLWPAAESPHAKRWQRIKFTLGKDSVDWSFWIKWYEAALAGVPLEWEMLEQIALISPKDWEQGPKWVNELIAAIEVEFALKAKIAELEGKLLQISSSGRGIGDNQGPPMVDEPVAKEIMIIWEPLQELKQEIEEKPPSRKRLLKIAKKLKEIVAIAKKLLAGTLSTAYDATIVLAVSDFVNVYANSQESVVMKLVQELSKQIEKYVSYII